MKKEKDMRIKSTKLTGIVAAMRDDLRRQAGDLRQEGETAWEVARNQAKGLLSAAKKRLHEARIEANRLEREADLIQEAINEELELQVKADERAAEAYEMKSLEHIAAELGLTDAKTKAS